MIKKMKKQMLQYHDSEEGSALLVSLGVVVLLFVVVVGIFFFAVDTQNKILLADRYTTLKDAKSYALEESKTRVTDYLDKEIRNVVNDVTGNPSDNRVVTTKVNQMLNTISTVTATGDITKSFFSSTAFGADKQYQFKVGILSNSVVEAAPVYSNEVSGGWSATAGANQVAKRITVPITVELKEQKGSRTLTHSASSHLVYEVQWEELSQTATPIKGATEVGKLDTWRNIFYNHYTNGENGLISADTWTRLLYRAYKYQATNQRSFDGAGYSAIPVGGTFKFGGVGRKSLSDSKLTSSTTALPALSSAEEGTKSLTKNLTSSGSFILQDVGLSASQSNTELKIANILAIVGDKTQDGTTFKNISAQANTGMIFSRQNQKTTFQNSQLTTASGLITQTRKSTNSVETALLLDGTALTTNSTVDSPDYNDYLKASGLNNPQVHPRWSDMLKGGLVIAGSAVELSNRSAITLGTNSNFILTNATIKEDAKGEESFSYQTIHSRTGATIPNPPSILKVDGQSKLIQGSNDFSFIDAPKKNRRASSSESGTQPKDQWLDASIARNTIEIASGGIVSLGVTGIEPFNLKLAKDAIFSFYAPSDPNLLDTIFLKEGVIKGKVIIYLWHEDFDVKSILAADGIPYKVKTSAADAANGEVTLIKDTASRDAGSRNILRTFSYIVDVDFMKKK